MKINVDGVTISIENSSPATVGNLALDTEKTISSLESMANAAMLSEESMDTTIRLLKDLSRKQIIRGQEGFAETAKNVGQSVLAFIEKIYNMVSQFIQKQVSKMLLNKFEKKVNAVKDKVNYWHMNAKAFDAYYDLVVTKGEKEFTTLIDAARANSKAHYENKQAVQSALEQTRKVVVNLSHANLMADGISGNKKVEGENIVIDNSKVVAYITDAKKYFNDTMAAMKTNQKLLNDCIKTLKSEGAANAQDSRIVGKFSNLCFKSVFGYYKLLASLTPVSNESAATPDKKANA